MAEKVGAQLVGMEYIQTYPICDTLSGMLLYVDDTRLMGGTIIVNKEGKRFVEELQRRDVMSDAIVRQTGSVCYEFWDEAAMKAAKIVENHGGEVQYLYKNKMMVKANTVKEAADFFGIDAVELQASIDRYNQYAKDGKDLEFNKRGTLTPFGAAPYYIVKACPAVHHTMGGVKIDQSVGTFVSVFVGRKLCVTVGVSVASCVTVWEGTTVREIEGDCVFDSVSVAT